jgi:carbon monoxide dehydrogenase subunit G
VSLKIEETFQVKAPVARVWAYLSDPRQVVNCLPGAELTSVESDTTFLGKVKVKVGPVTAAYNGKVTITERDDAAHVVKLLGDGRDASGGGSAKMTMTSTLAALGDGGTEVRVSADLDIVGKLAQFGRGMIESVNKQMFRQFTDCLRATLETPPVQPTEAAVAPTDATAAPTPTVASVSGTEPVRLLPIVLRAAWENLVGALRASWRALGRLVGRGTKL